MVPFGMEQGGGGMAIQPECLIQSLRIMTKADWRKLRNKYLNLQKKNMSLAKGKIRQMEAMQVRFEILKNIYVLPPTPLSQ